jgi:hypothetical protein
LTLYRDQPGPLGEGELADALAMAEVACEIILRLQAQVPPGSLHEVLDQLAAKRTELYQATGMVVVQLDVGPGRLPLPSGLGRMRPTARSARWQPMSSRGGSVSSGERAGTTGTNPLCRRCASMRVWTIMVAVDSTGCRVADEEVRRSWLERT